MLKKLLLVGGLLSVAAMVMGQEPDSGLDMEQIAANAILALVPVLSAVLTFFVRQIIPKIPRVVLPLVSAGLGIGLQAFLSWIAGGEFSVIVGAILGACGVWLREILNTLQEHGLE